MKKSFTGVESVDTEVGRLAPQLSRDIIVIPGQKFVLCAENIMCNLNVFKFSYLYYTPVFPLLYVYNYLAVFTNYIGAILTSLNLIEN